VPVPSYSARWSSRPPARGPRWVFGSRTGGKTPLGSSRALRLSSKRRCKVPMVQGGCRPVGSAGASADIGRPAPQTRGRVPCRAHARTPGGVQVPGRDQSRATNRSFRPSSGPCARTARRST
jgi:hypothetical protein